MQTNWNQLDPTCDTNAVFSLTYLVMTTFVRDALLNNYFDYNGDMCVMTVTFASRYIAAFNAWYASKSNSSMLSEVSSPWQEAFNWGASNQSTVSQDMMLGINSHINYDLAIVNNQLGWTSNPNKYLNDYNRVNDVLSAAMPNVTAGMYAYYDPSFYPGGPNDVASPVLLDGVIQWRNGAWLNGISLQTSLGDFSRQLELTRIEAAAVVSAKLFETPNIPPPNPARLEYCETHP